MTAQTNEILFQEIIKLQRKFRRNTPHHHGGMNRPPHPPVADGRRFEDRPHPPRAGMAKGAFPPPPRRERILRILLSEESGLRQKQLCETMGVGAPAMSETIERLEADGYVERIPDPEDKRATRILLTEKGKARAYEMQDNHEENMDEMFKNLTEDEKVQLIALLQKING